MIVGVPKEIKNHEYRVGLVPAGVRALYSRGHEVLIESGAGLGSGLDDDDFLSAGAQIVADAATVYTRAEMVVKVKEPLPSEYELLREGQIIYAFLHLAPAPELTQALLEQRVVGIAYETIQRDDGSLPLLTPMSEIAGCLSIQAGAHHLENPQGGRGQLLSGVAGALPGHVVILGGGTVGTNAARMAVGSGARVTVLDVDLDRLRHLEEVFGGRVELLSSAEHTIGEQIAEADLVVGAVLVAGARAPRLVTRDMLGTMREGSVIVDVAVDQGGCVETTRPTTHENPTYVVDGVIHYCVANMPGAVARTSTFALSSATLPHALALADKGWEQAIADDLSLRRGLNVFDGKVACGPVAEALGYTSEEPDCTGGRERGS